jgi:hypothetical protein
MHEPEESKRRLDAGQKHLFALLAGVTEEQFKRRPAATADDPLPWSIAEVLSHLLAGERLWCGRLKLALAEDGANITPSPPEAHEDDARAGRAAAVPQLIHGLLGVRREIEMLLAAASDSERSFKPNTLWHPRLRERLNLAWMFDKIAGHHEEHIVQIEALRLAVGAKPVEAQRA